MPEKVDAARALSFGANADNYERYRLGYPADVVDAVLTYAGGPVRTALEVGAGTGKATRAFADRGITVTALEPDAEMARVLTEMTRGLAVTPLVTTFEDFGTDARFDLLYAAAAWHWTDPATRWHRAAELLVPGGVLALFGRPGDPSDPDVAAAVEAVEKRLLGADADVHPWAVDEIRPTDGLVDVELVNLPSVATTSRERFVGRLATVSAYLVLDPDARAEALAGVAAVLPAEFEIDTAVELCLARRAPVTAGRADGRRASPSQPG